MTGVKSVFILDDDLDVAESLADILELSGHRVDMAHSGEAAVEKFRDHDYDIAFFDVRMPGMNGVESLLEILRFKPDARVVMMTAYSVQELLDEAVENGAIGVLHKPVEAQEILTMIRSG
jgi:DNA-binding NtrC family response regulator